jgi:hypothetical protein
MTPRSRTRLLHNSYHHTVPVARCGHCGGVKTVTVIVGRKPRVVAALNMWQSSGRRSTVGVAER